MQDVKYKMISTLSCGFPPFQVEFFDLVYSSGVIHHTNNTELFFAIIQSLVKSKGRLYVWLYLPYKSSIHWLILLARKITKFIPARIQFWTYFFTLLPLYKLILMMKGKKMGWREIMIDLLDGLTPFFRFEHEPSEVEGWFAKFGFSNVEVTKTDLFGFSIGGIKNDS
jgi:hypothetical protein